MLVEGYCLCKDTLFWMGICPCTRPLSRFPESRLWDEEVTSRRSMNEWAGMPPVGEKVGASILPYPPVLG